MPFLLGAERILYDIEVVQWHTFLVYLDTLSHNEVIYALVIHHGDLTVEGYDLYSYYSSPSRSYSYKIGLVKGKLLKTSCGELRGSNCISEADYEEFRKDGIS